ncbi:MAG: hypothetical protein HY842_19930 [Bacteroidetes bacterium]|nr:hypothetical protein [Bacteroidota bacterium]
MVISRHGKLSIYGLSKKNIGIRNDGELVIWGELTINRTVSANIQNSGLIYNSGSLAFDQPEKKGLIQPNGGRFENYGEVLFF